jgi:4-hydroxythreonine-4-phosphate dehydrogenase
MPTPTIMEPRRPRIPLTTGDPAGVGPEVVLKAVSDESLAGLAEWIIVGGESIVRAAAEQCGIDLERTRARLIHAGQLEWGDFPVGRVSAACGRASLDYIREATRRAVAGEADAIVTGPVNKEAVTLSGEHFTGHTEFIAQLCGATESRMLLVNDKLRVVHVTTHVSLRQACDSTIQRILRTIELGHEAMLSLGCENPRIGVCGLNPHAGESGLFGPEDAALIVPAIEAAARKGIRVEGPVPGDTVFLKAVRGHYDLVVAMYHDQGHIPMKLVDFENTVNVSLGLPIIRTSVDHGTAFDIAGKNMADPRSMKAAMRLAASMAGYRLRQRLAEESRV